MYSSETFGRLFWVDDNYDLKSCPQYDNGNDVLEDINEYEIYQVFQQLKTLNGGN